MLALSSLELREINGTRGDREPRITRGRGFGRDGEHRGWAATQPYAARVVRACEERAALTLLPRSGPAESAAPSGGVGVLAAERGPVPHTCRDRLARALRRKGNPPRAIARYEDFAMVDLPRPEGGRIGKTVRFGLAGATGGGGFPIWPA